MKVKRLTLLLAALGAAAAVAALPAAAHRPPAPSMTLDTPADVTLATGAETAPVTVTGALVDPDRHGDTAYGTFAWYAGGTCTDSAGSVPLWAPRVSHTDTFTITAVGTLTEGTWSFRAWTHELMSNCVMIHVLPAPVTPTPEPEVVPEEPAIVVPQLPSDEVASSYLCWNQEADNPVAYIDRDADAMWVTGHYFEPAAILGNVEGGTNIGAYHLVCKVPSGLQKTGAVLGGSGEVYGLEENVGYHLTHADGNDLNVYHIWK
jgi:hypothetical protein